MSDRPAEHHQPVRYELRVTGYLDDRWSEWFDDLTLTHESDGTTTMCGPVVDQAALHCLLIKIRDLGMTLVSVRAIDGLGRRAAP